ncbi:hypothetical protein B484DRAFT_121275 [Ochromonadaceae sp. CCMP2298]|nr:hypothetical protein B484DRAFT_121275 [Ochromonadaceae sp. CCMP2298]
MKSIDQVRNVLQLLLKCVQHGAVGVAEEFVHLYLIETLEKAKSLWSLDPSCRLYVTRLLWELSKHDVYTKLTLILPIYTSIWPLSSIGRPVVRRGFRNGSDIHRPPLRGHRQPSGGLSGTRRKRVRAPRAGAEPPHLQNHPHRRPLSRLARPVHAHPHHHKKQARGRAGARIQVGVQSTKNMSFYPPLDQIWSFHLQHTTFFSF